MTKNKTDNSSKVQSGGVNKPKCDGDHVVTFGDRLSLLIQTSGKSYEDICQGLNKSAGYFGYFPGRLKLMINGGETPVINQVKEIADFFGVHREWLAWGDCQVTEVVDPELEDIAPKLKKPSPYGLNTIDLSFTILFHPEDWGFQYKHYSVSNELGAGSTIFSVKLSFIRVFIEVQS